MINITEDNKEYCCGCSGCFQICPVKCINMFEDKEGFKYPQINKEKCISCNKCEEVCPIIKEKFQVCPNDRVEPKAIGGWHKDGKVRDKSSSGGAFTLFAEFVLRNNGVIFGAAFNENLEVKHCSVEKLEDLDKLRGSKYVQSDTKETYIKVRENLEKNRMVLFVGTPCQTAGLSEFLNKDYDLLFKCDFICHGVPSLLVFKKYITYLEEKYEDKIIEFKFRNKDKGWRQTGQQMGTAVRFKKGKVKHFMPAYKDFFMNGFLEDLYLRPSCYECKFKTIPKNYSDVTIADFWGVDAVASELNDKKGTSLVLINTDRGEYLFNKVKEKFHYKECAFCNAIKRNPVLLNSVKPPKGRNKFFEELETKSFIILAIKYMTAFSWAMQRTMKIIRKK
ncbi:Coenzyme F420 hydrogenase/dehydrogenase, beta subunit C-terminal domain [Clostridium sp. YIM B02555]|uniref:Coenzyme F420 hydrogenase/dehydrogenase, beta subunit C-terminal domain n=1 Tax=Clostridium sp. YIM B02555 TaxID=2911968 RepID=UPI001EEE2572|nr:Coenzyme F420 hydrogenase/dehydrogenase, beta subunit C-terminal domain [Clostridium sp. YIM B02555]